KGDIAAVSEFHRAVGIDPGAAIERQRGLELFRAAIASDHDVSARDGDAVTSRNADVLTRGRSGDALVFLRGRSGVDGPRGSGGGGQECREQKLVVHAVCIARTGRTSRRRAIPQSSLGASPDTQTG